MNTAEGSGRTITVVVPVYNSESSLPLLIERLWPVVREHASAFEAILVNDGSNDGSWETITRLSAKHGWVRGINLMRNYGQHNALLCGIRSARYGVVVTIDDDLQNPPEEIPKLLDELARGFDVVYGVPDQEQHGLVRDFASQVTKLALKSAMGASTARHVSAFRVFKTRVRRAFAAYRSPFVSIDVMLTWGASTFSHIHVRHEPRRLGRSTYTVRKLIAHAMNMMTGFSTIPLQLASLTGFTVVLFGVGVLVFVLGRFLMYGTSVPGFPFLASIISVFSGAQLFAVGIMGEYLARMHFRLMAKPPYAVAQRTENVTRDAEAKPTAVVPLE